MGSAARSTNDNKRDLMLKFIMCTNCNKIKNTASLHGLQVAYNDAIRILLMRSRWCSVSEMFVAAGVNTSCFKKHLWHKFTCRPNVIGNEIILVLSGFSIMSSQLWRCSCSFVYILFTQFKPQSFLVDVIFLHGLLCLLSGPCTCNKV